MDCFPVREIVVTPVVAQSLTLLMPQYRNPEITDEANTIVDYLFMGPDSTSDLLLEQALVEVARDYRLGNFCPLPCTAESAPFQHLMKVWERAKQRDDVVNQGLANFVWRPFDAARALADTALLAAAKVKFTPPRINVTVWVAPSELH